MTLPSDSRPSSITEQDEIFLRDVRLALADDDAFARLKQLPGIKGAIERLSATRGAEYRAIILNQTPALLDRLDAFRGNDAVGAPDLSAYPEGLISPTTWRYIKVVSDLQVLFGSLDGWHIAEIGVGYGGQCKVLTEAHAVGSYTFYDLEPVTRLAAKYARAAGSPAADTLHLADFRMLGQDAPVTYDLVISNWALSECVTAVQDMYIEHVLRRSRHGYITYNQISHLRGIESYRKKGFLDALGFRPEIMPEGLSGDVPEDMENFIVHWSSQGLPVG
jgi:putative sugar O-methyltransferase